MARIFRKYQFIKSYPITENIAFRQFVKFLIFKLRARMNPGKALQFKWIEGLKFRANKIDSGIVENSYQILQDYEESLFIIHFLRDNDVFLDIGSNAGHFSLLASGVAKSKSIAIEPVPQTFEKLSTNIKENNLENLISPLNIGVSDNQGQLFFSNDKNTSNHIVDNKYPNSIKVGVKPIDDILINEKSASLVKMDIEGYELYALRGARKLLSNQSLKAIVVELNGSGAKFGYSDQEVHQLLTENDFSPYRYDPFKRSLEKLKEFNSEKYNTIYIRDLDITEIRIRNSRKVKVGNLLI